MAKQFKDMTALGLPGVQGTGITHEGVEISVAGDYCIVSAICTKKLVLEVSHLARQGGWNLHGSPAYDGIRFHQWMVSRHD